MSIYEYPPFIQSAEILIQSKPTGAHRQTVVSKLVDKCGVTHIDIRTYQDEKPTPRGIYFPVHLIDMIEEGFRLATEPAEDPEDGAELTSTPGGMMSYDEVCRMLGYKVFENDAPCEKKKHK